MHCSVYFNSTVIAVKHSGTAVFISTSIVIVVKHSCTAVVIPTSTVIVEVACTTVFILNGFAS